MNKTRITSDGTAKGTHVYADDGHEIFGISEINIIIVPGDVCRMTVKFAITEMDVIAQRDETEPKPPRSE